MLTLYLNGEKITNLVIPSDITEIKNYTFAYCPGLTSITIPNSVESIGESAFGSCYGLTSIEIPNSVTSIGSYAFYGCSGLTSVTIGNSVTSIGDAAFRDCTGLTSITIPNSVTSIGDYAFYWCHGLTNVEIPNSVTSIGERAFYWCSGLTSIEIPNSVTSIGYEAFSNCSGLTSVTIGNSVTSIGDDAFQGCSGLTSITVNSGNSVYDSREGCNAIIETATNTLIAGCKNTIIPGSVTSIGESAFGSCYGLTSIEIPNSVTSIGSYAFYGCSGLTSVTIGNSVTSIGDYAFYGCTGLTEVYVNAKTPPTIDSSTFDNYSATLYVPTGTKAAYQAADYWKEFTNIMEMHFGIKGDVDGDETVDVADVTAVVEVILNGEKREETPTEQTFNKNNSTADVDGDGTVDVADVTTIVSVILGTDTANAAPAKAAATRAGEISTVSADGDGETLLINITNPGYEFSAIQFDLLLPEGIEVAMDEEYYEVYLGSRAHRKHSDPECAVQADGSLRVVIMSLSNALYNGTEGDVATATLKVNGATDGDYQFTIKNVVLSAPGSKEKLAPYTGWINVTGGVTGISDIKEERAESNDIYDLQGRKVTEPVKGVVYIVNGKKVIF